MEFEIRARPDVSAWSSMPAVPATPDRDSTQNAKPMTVQRMNSRTGDARRYKPKKGALVMRKNTKLHLVPCLLAVMVAVGSLVAGCAGPETPAATPASKAAVVLRGRARGVIGGASAEVRTGFQNGADGPRLAASMGATAAEGATVTFTSAQQPTLSASATIIAGVARVAVAPSPVFSAGQSITATITSGPFVGQSLTASF